MKAKKIEDLTRDDILVCDYSNACIICDKTRNEDGDYKEIARIIHATGDTTYIEKYFNNKMIIDIYCDELISVRSKLLGQLRNRIGSIWSDVSCNFYKLIQVGDFNYHEKIVIYNEKEKIRKELFMVDFLKSYKEVK